MLALLLAAVLLFAHFNCYKIAVPANLIDEVNPVLEFVDFRVQVIPYDTKPLWRIRQELCSSLTLGAAAIILPEQFEGNLAAAAIVQVAKRAICYAA